MEKHPRALGYLTASYAFFMVAFGILVASLVLYQSNQLHISLDKAYSTYAASVALLWILPLGGGYLSEKLGYANGARIGIVFCTLGFIALAASLLYIGLALFVVGNAFATPAIWCMVDHCYSKDSHLRESAFTLFYLFFNIGAIVGIFLGGYIASAFGFAYEFDLGALCLIFAFVSLHIAKDKIVVPQGRTIAPQVGWTRGKLWSLLILAAVITTPICMFLFHHTMLNNLLMIALLVVMIVVLARLALKQQEQIARHKLLAFLFLSLIAIAFWTLYSLEPSFLSVFISSNVDRNFLGIDIQASSYFAFDSIFVIIFGLILSRVWVYLSDTEHNPALSLKFAASLIIIGLGFGLLALFAHLYTTPMPSYYIVLAYAIFALAELLVSPLGISMVGSLAPEGQEGLMMGFWQLCIGISGVISGYIGIMATPPKAHLSIADSNPLYAKTFFFVALGAIICGIIVLLLVPKLKRLMREPPYDRPQL